MSLTILTQNKKREDEGSNCKCFYSIIVIEIISNEQPNQCLSLIVQFHKKPLWLGSTLERYNRG